MINRVYHFRLVFLFLLSWLSLSSVVAQSSYNVPASGSSSITTCNAIIRDNGGDNNYANSSNGYLVIQPATAGNFLRLTGAYTTESGYDKIWIYDGVGTNGTALVNGVSGSGTVDVLSSAGALTVKFTSDGSVTRSGFEFEVSCCASICECSIPANIIFTNINNGIQVDWTATSDTSVHQYIIEYGYAGFTPGTGTRDIASDNSYFIQGLTPGVTYDIYVYIDCGNDGVVSGENPGLAQLCVPIDDACISLDNLNAPNIHCTYGTFSNPYLHNGVVDFGQNAVSSRHTIVRNNYMDPRTGGQLSAIPPCDLYSVRLGNWSTGSEAESISYDYYVDTNESPILLLKYAAVLEDPNHSSSEQPRFKFELLDQNNQMIDPVCGAADYIANSSLGWHGSSILWKDWTYVGTDLSAYHGQTIRIRLTTFDCDQSGHYGYAYFNLNCKKKVIEVESCGDVSENTYTAPDGFAYRWYYRDAPTVTVSSNQSLTVNMDTQHGELCCQVISLNNSNCYFTLSTNLEPRYPLAAFATQIDTTTCWTCDFVNNSAISTDGITPNADFQPCETAHWYFGDGTSSDEYNPTHVFPGAGTYTVTLVAGLSNDACQDSISFQVSFDDIQPVINGVTDACQGDTLQFAASGALTYEWLMNDAVVATGDHYSFCIQTDTSIVVNAYSQDGCRITIHKDVAIHNNDTTLTAESCQGEPFTLFDFTLPEQNEIGLRSYTRTVSNHFGCDSVITLRLQVHPTKSSVEEHEACESYTWHGETYTESGEYSWMGQTIHGCDSLVTLRLSIWNNTAEETAVSCDSYQWNDQTYTESGDYVWHGQNIHGCDSAVTLHLTINPSKSTNLSLNVCEKYEWHDNVYAESGNYRWVGATTNGCDSVVNLHLNVIDTTVRIVPLTEDFCTNYTQDLSVESDMHNYLWSTGEVTEMITITHPGIYEVTVSDLGCSNSARWYVEACPFDLFLPNAITPGDNNGLNDYLYVPEYQQRLITDFTIDIYNRSGEVVYHSKDKAFKWNGEFHGKIYRDVVYNYVIHCTDLSGRQFLFRGSIVVL